jgi:hypothetical protein
VTATGFGEVARAIRATIEAEFVALPKPARFHAEAKHVCDLQTTNNVGRLH